MTRIAHLSDLHFGRIDRLALDALLQQLHTVKPDLVIISGDLTQRATRTEYQQAAAFLEQLPCAFLTVPGNHDMSAFRLHERLFFPWQKWRRFIHSDLEPVVCTPDTCIVGINTARRMDFSKDWSRGRISTQQIDWIQDVFADAAATQLKILVAHHPFWLPTTHRHRGLIGRRDQAVSAFQQQGPDLILSGHVHLDYCRIHEGIIISHAGTSTSNRLASGHANSFNLIEATAEQVDIARYHLDGHRFTYLTRQIFQRHAEAWYEH